MWSATPLLWKMMPCVREAECKDEIGWFLCSQLHVFQMKSSWQYAQKAREAGVRQSEKL